MDSVLTFMVEGSRDAVSELQKSFKNYFNHESIFLFKNVEIPIRLYLQQIKDSVKKEIIVSALLPFNLYNIIYLAGFTPVAVDVSLETGIPTYENVASKCNGNTYGFFNYQDYITVPLDDRFYELDLKIIDIYMTGIAADSENSIFKSPSDFQIYSLNSENIVSTYGGSLVINSSAKLDINMESKLPDYSLSDLNASFGITLLSDYIILFDKLKKIQTIYRNSVIKSEYHTYQDTGYYSSSYFPLILKKGLKDVQQYCKRNGLESKKAYENSIITLKQNLKCKNAKYLSSRTLLIPISLSFNNETIKLISKILSTLP